MDEREKKQQEICNLLSQLQSDVSDIGDWKIIKCQEYAIAGKELPYDVVELNKQRDAVRARIDELRKELEG